MSMPDAVAQQEAIAQADANVRMTQDSLQPEDRAAFQTDTPLVQSLLQFTSYFNMMANLNATNYKKMVNDMGYKITIFIFVWVVFAGCCIWRYW